MKTSITIFFTLSFLQLAAQSLFSVDDSNAGSSTIIALSNDGSAYTPGITGDPTNLTFYNSSKTGCDSYLTYLNTDETVSWDITVGNVDCVANSCVGQGGSSTEYDSLELSIRFAALTTAFSPTEKKYTLAINGNIVVDDKISAALECQNYSYTARFKENETYTFTLTAKEPMNLGKISLDVGGSLITNTQSLASSLNKEFRIEPNPISNSVPITISAPSTDNVYSRIVDLNGNEVSTQHGKKVSTEGISQGTYILLITAGEVQLSPRKVLIK